MGDPLCHSATLLPRLSLPNLLYPQCPLCLPVLCPSLLGPERWSARVGSEGSLLFLGSKPEQHRLIPPGQSIEGATEGRATGEFPFGEWGCPKVVGRSEKVVGRRPEGRQGWAEAAGQMRLSLWECGPHIRDSFGRTGRRGSGVSRGWLTYSVSGPLCEIARASFTAAPQGRFCRHCRRPCSAGEKTRGSGSLVTCLQFIQLAGGRARVGSGALDSHAWLVPALAAPRSRQSRTQRK